MAIAGKVAITPKGEWNANTTYEKLDLVFYENASYVATKPSTGVSPTDESSWMLVVQSAGGADLEAIISGTQQVGNAKTLDGHEAEYFLPKRNAEANGTFKLVNTGNGGYYLTNDAREIILYAYADGTFRLRDATNTRDIIHSTADGTNTFNGTASGNLPLSGGGTVSKAGRSPIELKSTNSNNTTTLYSGTDGTLGELGFIGVNNPTFRNTSGVNNSLLHTGNMASHVLPLNGEGTVKRLYVKNVNTGNGDVRKIDGADFDYGFYFTDKSMNGKTASLRVYSDQNKAYFVNNESGNNELLHTGNKPSGTYTGNGDATARTIATNGKGSTIIIYVGNRVTLITPHGGIGKQTSNMSAFSSANATFIDGVLTLKTDDANLNASGTTYSYEVL